MKRFFLLLILLFNISVSSAQELILPIIEVYDGDTIKTKMSLPPPLDNISVRLRGIDTPEMPAKSYYTTGKLGRAKCHNEAILAIAAKNFVTQLTLKSTGYLIVTNFEWGKYGSRIIGDVSIIISQNHINLVDQLLTKGYAIQYDGKKKLQLVQIMFKGLWVDDVRPLPTELSDWTTATSFHEAIVKLELLEFEELSLDHDLASFYGHREMTGYDIALWLADRKEQNLYIPPIIKVHSANPVGRKNIEAVIKRYLIND